MFTLNHFRALFMLSLYTTGAVFGTLYMDEHTLKEIAPNSPSRGKVVESRQEFTAGRAAQLAESFVAGEARAIALKNGGQDFLFEVGIFRITVSREGFIKEAIYQKPYSLEPANQEILNPADAILSARQFLRNEIEQLDIDTSQEPVVTQQTLDENRKIYKITWQKSTEGIYLPTQVILEVDPVQGEILSFHYQNFPLKIELTARYDKEYALATFRQHYASYNFISPTVEERVLVDKLDRQYLVWDVFGEPEQAPNHTYRLLIDAHTGKELNPNIFE